MTLITSTATAAPAEGIFLAIAGTLIIILLGIVGYFITQRYGATKEKEDRLTDAIEALRECVDHLGRTVAKIESGILAQNEICKLRHELIDERFKNIPHEGPHK